MRGLAPTVWLPAGRGVYAFGHLLLAEGWLHDRFLRTGLATLATPVTSTRDLAAATRAYISATDDLARQAGLAA